jgi:hypothetical protein
MLFEVVSIKRPCAGSSGAVHSVFLIDVYLDLENPGGSGFWVGENGRVIEGNKEGKFTSIREKRWTDPDTEGGFQVSRQGEQGEQRDKGNKGNKGQILYINPNLI